MADLLDDLFEFQQSCPKPYQYYCLQPLVVCKNHDLSVEECVVFDVIDGQQRLTTLFLLMGYLRFPSFELRYERAVRKDEDPTLWESGKLDYQTLQSLTDEEMVANPDYFYMKQAMACIRDWFEEKEKKYKRIKDMIEDVLLNRMYLSSDKPFYEMDEDENEDQPDVRFIWYEDEPTESNSIDTFKRLNYGKTPLTATESSRYSEQSAMPRKIASSMSPCWHSSKKQSSGQEQYRSMPSTPHAMGIKERAGSWSMQRCDRTTRDCRRPARVPTRKSSGISSRSRNQRILRTSSSQGMAASEQSMRQRACAPRSGHA